MHPNIPHHFERQPGDYPRRGTPKYGWRDDNGKPIHAINERGDPICGRICNLTKIPCQQPDKFLSPNGRCRSIGHGGSAPGAPLKSGRYSIFLPSRLAAHYEKVTNDDVLNNVRESIAIVVAMIQDKLADMSEESTGELWSQAKTAFQAVKESLLTQDESLLLVSLDQLGEILFSGSKRDRKEKEAVDLMKTASKLTKVEITRLQKLGQFMTAQQMLSNQATVLAILKKHVDPSTLSKVASELGIAAYANYA